MGRSVPSKTRHKYERFRRSERINVVSFLKIDEQLTKVRSALQALV